MMDLGNNGLNRDIQNPDDSSLESDMTISSSSSQPTYPKSSSSPNSLFRYNKTAFLATSSALAIIVLIGLTTFVLSSFNRHSSTPPINASEPTSKYNNESVPLQGLKVSNQLEIGEADHLAVNGQLQVNDTLILSPTNVPTSPVPGEIYYSQATNQPYYFNGTQFISLLPTAVPQHVTSLGGAAGALTLGNGLQVNGSQLAISSSLLQSVANAGLGGGVSSLQGLTGKLVLTAGGGIAVSGTSITNTGVLSLSGTNNQVSVSSTTGNVTLSLPQDIDPNANVQFNNLILSGNITLPANGVINTDALGTINNGDNLAITGSNNITFSNSNGANTFVFPTSGGPGQVICTTAISCAAGGGQAVLLEPTGIQSVTANKTSIFVNKAGGTGNLIDLQDNGNDEFVVNNTGTTTISNLVVGTTLAVQGAGGITVGVAGTVTGNLSLANNASNRLVDLQGLAPSGAGNATIQFPSIAGGSSDTVCLVTLANCSGSNGGSGNTNYIENQTTPQTNANFDIAGVGSSVTAVIEGASGGGDITDFKNSGGSTVASISSTGGLTSVGVNSGTGLIQGTGGASISGGLNNNAGGITNAGAISGATTVTSSSNINTTAGAFELNGVSINTAGTLTDLAYLDQANTFTAAGTALTVNNNASIGGTLAVKGNGGLTLGVGSTTNGNLNLANSTNNQLVDVQGLAPSGAGNATIQFPSIAGGSSDTVCLVTLANCSGSNGGSGNTNYIENQTTPQTNANFDIAGVGSSVTAVIEGASGGGDITDFKNSGGSTVASISSTGGLTSVGVNSGTGLIQGTGGASISGGLNNNAGGITNAGAISGATTVTSSSNINTTAGAFELNGVSINTAGTLTDLAYLDQANTFTAAGTALTVNNNASIGGTLAVKGNGGLTLGVGSTTNGNLNLANSTNNQLVDVQGLAPSGAGNATIQFPSIAGGSSDTVCLVTLANCSGSNGGSGNTNYIENQTTPQTNANFDIAGVGSSVTAVIEGASGGGDITDFKNSGGSTVASISSTGGLTSVGVNSGTGLIQGTGGASISGGLNNNAGGITNAGAISGATTVTSSSNINTTAGAFELNGVSINTAGTLTDLAYLDQANTFTAAGTALTVNNNASIGGTLAVKGNGGLTLGVGSTTNGNLNLANSTNNQLVDVQGLAPSGAGNATIQFPSIAGGSSDTVCLVTLANCSGSNGGSGNTNYIENQTTPQTNANFDIAGVGSSVTAVIEGASGGGDITDFKNSGGSTVASISSTGGLTSVGVNSGTGLIQGTGGASISGGLNNNAGGITNAGAISGATTVTSSSNINTTAGAFELNGVSINTAGTLTDLAYLDQANTFTAAGTALTVNNNASIGGTLAVKGNGGLTLGVGSTTNGNLNLANSTNNQLVDVQGLAPSGAGNATIQFPSIAGGSSDTVCLVTLANCSGSNGGSGNTNYIENQTTPQTNANFDIAGVGSSVTAVIEGASGGGDITDFKNSGGSTVASISSTGGLTSVGVNSGTGLIQGTGGASISGGLNNNAGGITNAGAISGATTVTSSSNINTTAGAFELNGVSINTAGTLTDLAYLDQANTFTAAGTALTVNNNASIGGTLAVKGNGGLTLGVGSTTNGNLNLANSTNNQLVDVQGLAPSGAGNATIQFPSIAGGSSDTVCLVTLANCSGSNGGSGNTNYIENQTTPQTNANFDIAGVGSSVTAVIEGASGGGDITDFKNSGGSTVASISSTGGLTSVGVNSGTGLIQGTGGASISGGLNNNAGGITNAGAISGATTVTSSSNINTTAGAFELNGVSINTAGTLTDLAYLDQANTFTAAGTALTVNNNASIGGTLAVKGNGGLTLGVGSTTNGNLNLANSTNNQLVDVQGLAPSGAGNATIQFPSIAGGSSDTVCLKTLNNCFGSGGSGSYIQNGTTTQSANFNVQAATSGSVAATIQANAAGTGDILDLENGSNAKVATVGSTGSTLFENSSNSSTAFQVQNDGGVNLFEIDTSGDNVNLGATGTNTLASTVNIGTSANAAQTVNIGSGASTSTTNIQAGTGDLTLLTGSATGDSGSIIIQSGDSSSGTSGNVSIDTGASAISSGANIEDDTFESGLDGWGNAFNTSVAQSTAQAHSGTHSLAITSTSSAGWAVAGPYPGASVTAGQLYNFTVWVRGTVAENIRMVAAWIGSASANVTIGTVTDSTTGWTEISGSATAPAGDTNVQLAINGQDAGGVTTYVDDITVSGGTSTPAILIGATNAAAVLIGNSNEAGVTTLQGGSGGVAITASTGDAISVGNANNNIITIGNSTSTEPYTQEAEGITDTITGSATAPSDIIQTTTDSTTAFQIQNASAVSLFNVDTSNNIVDVGATGVVGSSTTVNVGTSSNAAQTVNIGSTDGASQTTIQGGTVGIAIQTGSNASGNSGSIIIQSGGASGTSGNISIDNGAGMFNSGSFALDDTFENSPCSAVATNFGNWGGTSSIVGSNAQAQSGLCSMAVTESGTDGGYWGIQSNNFSITAGDQYTFTVWVRAGSLAQTMNGEVSWGGVPSSVTLSTVTDTTSGWTEMTGSGVAPSGGFGYAYFLLANGGGGNGSSTTYFDNITATANASAPAIDIGTSNAQTISIGNANQQGITTLQGGSSTSAVNVFAAASGTVNIANSPVVNTLDLGAVSNDLADTVNINSYSGGSATKTTNVGSGGGASATTIQGGTGDVSINTGSGSSATGSVSILTGNSSTTSAGSINIDTGTSVVSGSQIEDKTFESGVDNMGGWFGVSSVAQSAAEAHSGTHSLAVTENSADWATMDMYPGGVTVIPGHEYAFTAWVRANTVPEDIDASVEWGGGAGGGVSWNSGIMDSNSTWTEITGELVAPAYAPGSSTEYASLAFNDTGGGSGVSGQIQYFDDITITDLGTVSTPAINIGTSNAQTLSIGNESEGGFTNLYGGTNGIQLQAANDGIIAIGTVNQNDIQIGAIGSTSQSDNIQVATSNAAIQTVNIGGDGDSGGSSTGTTIGFQAGQTNINLTNSGADLQTFTNSSSAFEVQNADGVADLIADTTATTNYITDADFAVGSGSSLTDWTELGAPSTYTQNNTASNTYEGNTSLEMITNGAGNNGVTTSSFTSAPPTAATGGTGTDHYYTASFYVEQTTGAFNAANQFQVQATQGANTPTCIGNGEAPFGAGGFVQISCILTFAGSGTISALQIVYTGAGIATFYIDDVQLQVGSTVTPFQLGNLQLRGIVTNPVALQNVSNSNTAFQIQNSGGSNVLDVNTDNSSVTLTADSATAPVLSLDNSDGTAGIEFRTGGSGSFNTFIGYTAGMNNTLNVGSTQGYQNTGIGNGVLSANTTGSYNTGLGVWALHANLAGSYDTAIGNGSESNLNSSSANTDTALGNDSLNYDNTGASDTAVGSYSLYYNNGSDNTAIGGWALTPPNIGDGTTGADDTALGYYAGASDTNGFYTSGALQNATAIGYQAQVQASNSIVLGDSGSNAVNVGIGTTIPLNTFSVSPVYYSTGTAYDAAGTSAVTGIGTTWTSAMIGMQFIFSDGENGIITAVGSTTSLTLNASVAAITLANAENYRIQNPGFEVTSAGNAYVQNTSTNAFQVQNSAGAALFTADTTNSAIVLGQDTTPTNLTVRGGVASGSNVGGGNITFQASNGTGAAGSGSFIFQTAAPSGSIALDNTAYTGGSNNITLSFTTGSGGNRLLMVQAETNASRSFSGITYNGVAMTQIATKNSLTNDDAIGAHVELWYLVNPASGTHNIVATMVGSGAGSLAAASFTNVNQSTPLGTAATANGTATGTQLSSVSVSTTAGQLVMDAIGSDVASGGVGVVSPPYTGQSQLWYAANTPSLYGTGGSTSPGTGSTVNMKWYDTNSDWADIAVPINPITNSASDTLSDSLVVANSGNIGIDNTSPQYSLDVNGSARVESVSNSSSAFQVQNATGVNELAVDTSGNNVTLGTVGSLAGKLTIASSNAGGSFSIGASASQANTTALTLPTDTNATDTVCLQTLSNCSYYQSSTNNYLVQVPSSNSAGVQGADVISPTAPSIVGLTVNGTTNATNAVAAQFNQAGNADDVQVVTTSSGTQTNGLLVERNNGVTGATTSLLHITNAAGTVTNALTISGTYTTLINAPTFNVSNAGVVTLQGNQAPDITTNNVSSGTATSIAIQPGSTSTNSGTSANLTLQGGNETGTTSTGGNVIINGGSGTTTNGAVSIGTATTASVTIGNTSPTTVTLQGQGITDTLTGSATAPSDVVKTSTNSTSAFQVQNASAKDLLAVDTSGNNVYLGATGSTALSSTVDIGNSSSSGNAQTVNIGSTASSSTTNINAGTGNLSLTTGNGTTSSGSISLETGNASSGVPGNVNIDTGTGVITGSTVLDDTFEGTGSGSGDDLANCDYGCSSVAPSNTFAHTGSYSLAVTENNQYWAIVQNYLDMSVAPGHQYYISAWFRGTNAETIEGQIFWDTGATTNLNTITDTTTGWTEMTGTVVAPAGVTAADLAFASASGPLTGTYTTYLDDVFVQDVSSITSPAVNIGATNAEAVTVGNSQQAGLTSLIGGAGGISIQAATNATINVGTNNDNNINIGSSGGQILMQGTGQQAVQVQDSSNVTVFDVDTTNDSVGIGTATPTDNRLDVVGSTDDNTAYAINATNSLGGNLIQARNDGAINIDGGNGGNTMGYTLVGGSAGNGEDGILIANQFIAPSTGNITSVSGYVGAGGGVQSSPNNQYQFAVYTDSSGQPNTYLGSTSVGTLNSSAAWDTLNLTSPLSLTAGTPYWLVYWSNATGTGTNAYNDLSFDGSGGSAWYVADSFGSGSSNGLPTSFPGGGSSDNVNHSIYATYGPSGLALSSAGDTSVFGTASFQDQNNSSTAFQIQNSSGTDALIASTNNVTTGWNSANATLDVAKDSGTGRSINAAGSISTSGADYAEYFDQATPGQLQPGQLVCLNVSQDAEPCVQGTQDTLVGAVSTNAGYVGNDIYNPADPNNTVMVGLIGQIEVNVSTVNGPIAAGDMLAMSPTSGVAEKATSPGMVIGTALQPYTGSGTGMINVYVHVSYFAPTDESYVQNGASATLANLGVTDDTTLSDLNVSGQTTLTDLTVQTVTVNSDLTVEGLTTVHDIQIQGHIITSGTTPVATTLPAAGSSNASVQITGNDTSGTITITTGDPSSGSVTGPTIGDLVQLQFNKQYTGTPRVVLSPDNGASAGLQAYSSSVGETSFNVSANTQPAANATYVFTYFVVQ